MEEELRVTPVIGLPQSTGWSQVVEHRLDGNRQLVVSLAVGGENASNIGREMIDHVLQQPPKSAQGLYQAAEELIAKAKHLRCEVSFVLSFLRRFRVTFVTHRAQALLKRDNKIGLLIKSDGELGVVEGKYQLDDLYVLATRQAEQFLSQIKINFEKGYEEEGVIDAIVPAVHTLDDSAQAALAFIAVKPGQKEGDSEVAGLSVSVETNKKSGLAIALELAKAKKDGNQPEPNLEDPTTTTAVRAQKINSDPQLKKRTPGIFKLLDNFFASIWNSIKFTPVLFRRLFSANTYVGVAQSRRALGRVIIAAIVIAILAGLIGFFMLQSRSRQEQTATVMEPFKAEIAQIESLAISDPLFAREEMSGLIEQIKTRKLAADESGNKWMVGELNAVLIEAEAALERISGIDEVSDLPIFFDLRMVDSDFIATQTERVGDQLVAIDREQQQLISLDLNSKAVVQNEVDGESPIRSIAADLAQDEQAILLLSNGIFSIPLKETAVPVELKAEGDSNQEATLIGSYNSYAYVFNPEKRNIYRYIFETDGYSDPVGWLSDPLGIAFDQVVDWAIDGEIWITSNTGEIIRFRSGRKVEFSINGMENSFVGSLQINTDENMDNLYLMEPDQNRVVILSKNGDFIREVSNQSIGAATSFVVDAAETTAYLISGSTIFELAL